MGLGAETHGPARCQKARRPTPRQQQPLCKPVKLCYNIMLYRANPARICPNCVRKERERQNILKIRGSEQGN